MPFPRMSFPAEGELRECSDWCKPIHMVEKAIAGQAFAKYFRVDDFMWMGKLHRKGRPDLILHKHYLTRRYLNLDATATPTGTSHRRRTPHRTVSTARTRIWSPPSMRCISMRCRGSSARASTVRRSACRGTSSGTTPTSRRGTSVEQLPRRM